MKKKILIIGIVLVCFIGISYALWGQKINGIYQNKLVTSCLSLTLTNEQNAINLQNAYPIYDEEGKELTPYTLTIENTCDIFASYIVQIEMTNSSTLPTKYVRAMVNMEEIQNLNEYEESTSYVNAGTKEARILARGSLGFGDSEDYTLRLWIDSDVTQDTTEAIGKTLSAIVTISAVPSTYSPVKIGITLLKEAVLVNEYQTSKVQNAIDRINLKQSPDFTKVAPIIEWAENYTTSTTATIAYNMPRAEDVGSANDYATNLTSTNVYVGFSNTYTFDSETGRYSVGKLFYQNPSTIDFSSGSYYTCGAGTYVTSESKLSPSTESSCTTLYKVGSLSSVVETTISDSDGTSYPATRYTFQVSETHTQVESESDKSDKGLYAMQDDYGTSYYYRGSVNNNWVYFAGYYWRIIRVNGDGSVRLLYAGKTAGATGSDAQVGSSTFNPQRNLPMYVGYMYGDASGTTLAEVNANTNDSNIKTYLENWYANNLNSYASYMADAGFCNDRTISTGDGVTTSSSTYFATYNRYYTTYSPTLVCSDATNDLFTISNTLGNQKSSYPIGLITVDELMLAGFKGNNVNKLAYPYNDVASWTMTPYYFSASSSSVSVFRLGSGGFAYGNAPTNSGGVRPVINLSSTVEIESGIGTVNNPFVVKTT